jgi:hypothetical protein
MPNHENAPSFYRYLVVWQYWDGSDRWEECLSEGAARELRCSLLRDPKVRLAKTAKLLDD